MDNKKKIISIILFTALLILTFRTVFAGHDIGGVMASARLIHAGNLMEMLSLAVMFVALEGTMIWCMLKNADERVMIGRCITYSFVGFFYSAITPSATGGQPVQLYYMKKDGRDMAKCSITLVTIAFLYKLVLVVTGVAMLIFWYAPLRSYMQGYFYLFLLGIALNLILVVLLSGVILYPSWIERTGNCIIDGLERLRAVPAGKDLHGSLHEFIRKYAAVSQYFRRQIPFLIMLFFMTFVQRSTLFVLTYLVYRGFGLTGTAPMTVMLLQAAVYIAVDMLPLPGAQGITELVYQQLFAGIFGSSLLLPSMLVSHGINFYFLFIVSAGVILIEKIWNRYFHMVTAKIIDRKRTI